MAHGCRHTAVSLLANRMLESDGRIDWDALADYAGHSDSKVTRAVYAELNASLVDAARLANLERVGSSYSQAPHYGWLKRFQLPPPHVSDSWPLPLIHSTLATLTPDGTTKEGAKYRLRWSQIEPAIVEVVTARFPD